ncbi:MAG: polyphosphate:AMP phosphotransferase [Gammaproteobacteria bacterium]|nr:polyphosphate:AMP phosphotransferase [Gammaproteobacteria bacterium]MBU1654007.1 polyphosphate:AMP phosphotransferase [Gammaproteobacteria bacterium]MBU1960734.1 polyphosphate:AMP phosphotransferase [Gammaproteobacteria bacterium]
MFEAAKLNRKVSKQDFKDQEAEIRTHLLALQRELNLSGRLSVILIVAGIEGAGKGEVVNRLSEWMDTRGIATYAFWDQTEEEKAHPRYWKFWRAMPPKGKMAIFFGGWYLELLERRMMGDWDDEKLGQEFRRIEDFERMLSEEGVLVVKFWYHMSEKDQRKRLQALSRDDRSRWKMLPKKNRFSEHYVEFERVAERLIRYTDTGVAPWYIIEATNPQYRDLTTARTLLTAIGKRMAVVDNELPIKEGPYSELNLPLSDSAQVTVLDKVDLTQTLTRAAYRKELCALRDELNELAWAAYKNGQACVLIFEGWDAAGKGGAIRRLANAIDARLYRTISIAAPTDEEKAHHYLWRFWRHIPRPGRITLFDRSWYGRVLVERVEGFADEQQWRRAYSEINDFEGQLIENGILVLKFWLHIDKEEQLNRFQERETVPYKQHKITEEDWRNRERWDDYKQAVHEMVVRTGTEKAPWILIPGNDKKVARINVLRTIRQHLKEKLAGIN